MAFQNYALANIPQYQRMRVREKLNAQGNGVRAGPNQNFCMRKK